MASKEAIFVDNAITKVLEKCFSAQGPVKSCQEGKLLFASEVANHVVYFNKVRTFELAYDAQLAKVVTADMKPIAQTMPSSLTLSLLYIDLIRNTILDSKITTVAFSAKEAVGTVPPRIYVLCNLMASISATRSYNDNLLAVLFSGASSTGKSKLLHSFTCLSKVIAYDAQGVGRYGIDASHKSIYYHDVSFNLLTGKSEFPIVKNILRGERASVKVNKITLHLIPTYVYITSNDVLFPHFLEGSYGVVKQLATGDTGLENENLQALKNRIIEVRFYKKGKVNPRVFDYDINLFQAKAALAALLLMEFKNLKHPMAVGCPTLFPAVLQGIRSVMANCAEILSISDTYLSSIIDKYEKMYLTSDLSIPNVVPLKYNNL